MKGRPHTLPVPTPGPTAPLHVQLRYEPARCLANISTAFGLRLHQRLCPCETAHLPLRGA